MDLPWGLEGYSTAPRVLRIPLNVVMILKLPDWLNTPDSPALVLSFQF